MAQQLKNPPVMQETQESCIQSLGWKVPIRRAWQPLYYSCWENIMDRGYSPWDRKQSDKTEVTEHGLMYI